MIYHNTARQGMKRLRQRLGRRRELIARPYRERRTLRVAARLWYIVDVEKWVIPTFLFVDMRISEVGDEDEE